MTKPELTEKQSKSIKLIIAYPFALLLIAVVANLFLPQIQPFEPQLPSVQHLAALAITAVILTVIHSVLMTTTEVTRATYKMYATPEEWEQSDSNLADVSEIAKGELARNHNAHRNATENSNYFVLLVIPFLLVSPPLVTTYIWLVGFALSRLGHAIAFLTGSDNWRGVFMTISLIAMYGVASYLALSGMAILI